MTDYMRPSLIRNSAATLTLCLGASSCALTGEPSAPPQITVKAASLTFTAVQGSSPASQSVEITNTGGGVLAWTASTSAPWLTATPTQGTAPVAILVTPNGAGLDAGVYTGVVTIVGTNATNSPRTIDVTFTLTAPPAVGLSATTFEFSGVQGGPNPASQSLTISNTGGGTLNWTAAKTASWLTLSSLSGTAPSTVMISASLAGLTPGTYQGLVTLTATGAVNSPLSLTVTLTVGAAATIGLSPTSFAFTGGVGGPNPAGKALNISNTGGGTLAWTASSDAAWLSVSSASGTAPSTVTINVSTTGLAAGTYNGIITVVAAGATNTPQTVPVQLVISPLYDGSWSGKTSQDSTITFTVANNAITQISFGWRATGSCTVNGRTTTTFNTPLSVASGGFSISTSGSISYSLSGTFGSATTLSGTLSLNFSQSVPSCSASTGPQTFTASKP